MSCSWISNREKKSEEKTVKYGPLRWELKEKQKGYKVHQYNIIMDVLGGWSEETETSVQSLVGRKTTHVLERIQKAAFIADAQYCKNFQSINMMMLIDQPWKVIGISFRHPDYDFYICIYILFIYLFTYYFKFRLAHRVRYAPCVAF